MANFIGAQQIGNVCFDAKSINELINIGGNDFVNAGQCPNCKTNDLKGMLLLKAEAYGFIAIDQNEIRKLATSNNTQFVLCQYCGWWGCPNGILGT